MSSAIPLKCFSQKKTLRTVTILHTSNILRYIKFNCWNEKAFHPTCTFLWDVHRSYTWNFFPLCSCTTNYKSIQICHYYKFSSRSSFTKSLRKWRLTHKLCKTFTITTLVKSLLLSISHELERWRTEFKMRRAGQDNVLIKSGCFYLLTKLSSSHHNIITVSFSS